MEKKIEQLFSNLRDELLDNIEETINVNIAKWRQSEKDLIILNRYLDSLRSLYHPFFLQEEKIIGQYLNSVIEGTTKLLEEEIVQSAFEENIIIRPTESSRIAEPSSQEIITQISAEPSAEPVPQVLKKLTIEETLPVIKSTPVPTVAEIPLPARLAPTHPTSENIPHQEEILKMIEQEPSQIPTEEILAIINEGVSPPKLESQKKAFAKGFEPNAEVWRFDDPKEEKEFRNVNLAGKHIKFLYRKQRAQNWMPKIIGADGKIKSYLKSISMKKVIK
jgi:hypothetical protein